MVAPHNVVIAGATGSVGRRCVYFALKHESVASVTALVRSAPVKDAAFFGLDLSNAVEKTAFESKLKQKVIDYSSPEQVTAATANHSAGISCLGVYTSNVGGFEDFMNKEHTPNLALARAAAASGTKRWGYLSGQGVVQPEKSAISPSFFQPVFAFVKGSVERDLASVEGFEGTTSARPGLILNRGNKFKGVLGWIESNANKMKWIESTRFAVQTDDIAKALVQSVLSSSHPIRNEILENEDIKRRAREFDEASAPAL